MHIDNKSVILDCKKEFISKTITSIILVGLLLVIPIFYSKGIDYLSDSQYIDTVIVFIILGIITLIYRLVEILNQKAYYKLYSKLYKKYLGLALEKSCNNSLYSLSRFSLSEYSNILSEDLELVSEYYATLIIRIVEILQFIYIIIYFFFINKIIGLITLMMSLLTIIGLFYANRYIVKTNEIRKNKNDLRISKFQEIFLSIREIKGFNIFGSIQKDLENDVDSYIMYNNKLNIDKYNLRQVSLLIVDIFKVICLIYSINLIIKGYITLGIITIVYSYYSKLSELFISIITLNESISNVKVAKRRIFKLFQYADDKKIDNGLINFKGYITFNNVLYGNRNNPLLKDVSFHIDNNTLTVLTGSLKASKGVFELLLRYNRQHTGSIFIDDLELEKYSRESISNNIAYLLTNPIFFNKTIKDNLLIFDSNFANIISVCKYLEIDDLILSYDEGYSTMLYNNAANIDNNLRYMLAFARILLKKSKIILLEDFLDNLSRHHRQLITNLLFTMKNEHTLILISNNRNIISNNMVDKVIYFKNNLIEDSNTHKYLYKNNLNYQKYYDNL